MQANANYQKNKKYQRGLPGIEPGTASTLKKNHTTRPKPLINIFKKKLIFIL